MGANTEKLILITLLCLAQRISATEVIYNLDYEEYSRLPVKNHLDRFEPCVGRKGGVFCMAQADLVSDEPNELLRTIQGYSAHTEKNFNYSNVNYGLCITTTCREFYDGNTSDAALWKTAEACLNQTFEREHGLKTRLYANQCYRKETAPTPDSLDIAVAAFLLAVLACNILGSLYDFVRDQNKPGHPFLMAFSIRKNVKFLFAPASTDPRQMQLRSLNGVRVMTAMLVILGHVPVPSVISVSNPTWFEYAYRIMWFHILYQGHIITLTFFLISGFLLAYNVQLQSEKRDLSAKLLPKAILFRWLRLTPVSMVVLLFTMTLSRLMGQGPWWWLAIGQEVQDCRNYWIYNALYINNLNDHSTCNLQMWSLASDMQLHIIGLVVAVAIRNARARAVVLGLLYAVGVLWPAYHIYTKDLDGTMLATPSTISTFFVTSDAFNYVYKRTYANLPCFVMGMAFGYYIYDLQKKNRIRGDYTKYRIPYYMCLPMLPVLVLVAYFLFFMDAPRASIVTRLLFAPTIKPLFGAFVMLIILGAIFKVENVVRGLLEWEGWVPMSRISYCMYAIHVILVRFLGGSKNTVTYLSTMHMAQEYIGTLALTIVLAAIFHLVIEAPFAGLVRDYIVKGADKAPSGVKGQTNGDAKQTNGVTKQTNGVKGHSNGIKKD